MTRYVGNVIGITFLAFTWRWWYGFLLLPYIFVKTFVWFTHTHTTWQMVQAFTEPPSPAIMMVPLVMLSLYSWFLLVGCIVEAVKWMYIQIRKEW